VTGGIFFGSDASDAASQLAGHFPDSQDQRHTVRGRVRYQLTPRGLDCLRSAVRHRPALRFRRRSGTVLAQYGQQVLNRINFARGRIYPAFQANASAGAEFTSPTG
jgi:hypothetical protein